LTKLYGVDPNPYPCSSRDPSFSAYSSNNYDYSFKIVLLGASGVGKSCILRRFYDNTFSESINVTGGADLVRKTVQMGDETIQLIIWDTIGQEKFKAVISTCVREAQGIIFVYDIRRKDTLKGINYWWQFALDYAPKEAVKILVGNQVDLADERVVQEWEGEAMAKKLGIPYLETSAKDARNVEGAFRILTAQILENEWVMTAVKDKMKDNSIRLDKCRVSDDEDDEMDGPFGGCIGRMRKGWDEFMKALRSVPHFISEL
jgi:Ras-related protein Rab-1A